MRCSWNRWGGRDPLPPTASPVVPARPAATAAAALGVLACVSLTATLLLLLLGVAAAPLLAVVLPAPAAVLSRNSGRSRFSSNSVNGTWGGPAAGAAAAAAGCCAGRVCLPAGDSPAAAMAAARLAAAKLSDAGNCAASPPPPLLMLAPVADPLRCGSPPATAAAAAVGVPLGARPSCCGVATKRCPCQSSYSRPAAGQHASNKVCHQAHPALPKRLEEAKGACLLLCSNEDTCKHSGGSTAASQEVTTLHARKHMEPGGRQVACILRSLPGTQDICRCHAKQDSMMLINTHLSKAP